MLQTLELGNHMGAEPQKPSPGFGYQAGAVGLAALELCLATVQLFLTLLGFLRKTCPQIDHSEVLLRLALCSS